MEIASSTDEYSNKRYKEYGTCSACKRYNTNWSWCQSCDPQLLTQGWSSGNETIDEIIKSTQLKATECNEHNNYHYLQWIPYEDLKDIERVSEGGFATVYKSTWINGMKYADGNKRACKDVIVALKKLHKSQNISEEFLNEVINFIFFFFFNHPLLLPYLFIYLFIF